MGNKKLENIFVNSNSSKKKKKNLKKNKDELETQDIIRLVVLGYSVYYYYTPVKTIFFDFLQNKNILETIISMYKLFFSIDSTTKFIFYFFIYVLL
jgi:hypothetical protein